MAKYKVTVKKIYASSNVFDLKSYKIGIVGISMSNPVFWRSSLYEILEWASQTFETTYLVIGDYLNRFNENILHTENEIESGKNAVKLGDEFTAKLSLYLEDFPKNKFIVMRWMDMLKQPENEKEIEELLNIYDTNPPFKKAIDENAKEFIEILKKRGKNIIVNSAHAVQLSAWYLLEELAIFNKMISNGNKVIVYPGAQLSILTSIAEGDFSEMSTYLKDGIYVQLNVSKT